tara:strand:- start:3187 stop:3312 length:126 start_codon:yes stop_codon:yes gene_type:complete
MLNPDKKLFILNVVEELNVDKKAELYQKIYEHVEQHARGKL